MSDIPKLAVLIDADNASPKVAAGLFEEIARIGEASLRRIYGDFSGTRLKGWAEILSKHAILPHQQFAYTQGKNSSDIALVIDAMDLLHSGRFDGFCLVSSDSDFTRLAARIREQGSDVYGIGQAKTPESFRQACTRFIFTENFDLGEDDKGKVVQEKVAQPPKQIVPLIRKVVGELEEDADGWYNLGVVGKRLLVLSSEFDTRTYGYAKLSSLIEATGQFQISRTEGKGVRMRPRNTKR